MQLPAKILALLTGAYEVVSMIHFIRLWKILKIESFFASVEQRNVFLPHIFLVEINSKKISGFVIDFLSSLFSSYNLHYKV